jgi:hypothetical protein
MGCGASGEITAMSVTITVCSEKGCGLMLNGELCKFVNGKPYCETHAYRKVYIEPGGWELIGNGVLQLSRITKRQNEKI